MTTEQFYEGRLPRAWYLIYDRDVNVGMEYALNEDDAISMFAHEHGYSINSPLSAVRK